MQDQKRMVAKKPEPKKEEKKEQKEEPKVDKVAEKRRKSLEEMYKRNQLAAKLCIIQTTISVPKGQTNKFGGYKYRNCEDILKAVKPLLDLQGLTIELSDEIKLIGDRYYVESTATISDGKDRLSSKGYAREAVMKKGMDEAQITGASSSYARKYALNGLLAIDDGNDSDSINGIQQKVQKNTPPPTPPKKMALNEKGMQMMRELVVQCEFEKAKAIASKYQMNKQQAEEITELIKEVKKDNSMGDQYEKAQKEKTQEEKEKEDIETVKKLGEAPKQEAKVEPAKKDG